jgi:hypothetical protein
VVELGRMKIWNYNEYRPDLPTRVDELLGRGVASFDIQVAGDDLVFTTLRSGLSLERGPAALNPGDFGETFSLGGVSARYVRLRVLSNRNGRDFTVPGDDGLLNFAGLSEVQFYQVPEPGSVVLVLTGLGAALGISRVRRRSKRID